MHRPSLRINARTVFLAGSARSGTTWLAGLLASRRRYRLLFEPFQPHQVEGATIVADRYYDPANVPASVVAFVQKVFDDRINSDWIASHSNRRLHMHRWRWWPRARIVKDVRANLMIPALRDLSGGTLPIVWLVRDPVEVILSGLRVQFPWADDIETLTGQSLFARTYGIPVRELSQWSSSRPGRLAIRWVIENAFLYGCYRQLGLIKVAYSELRKNPVKEIQRISTLAGLEPPSDIDRRAARLSPTTHPRSPLRSPNPVQTRHDGIEREIRELVGTMLKVVGLEEDQVYASNPSTDDDPEL